MMEEHIVRAPTEGGPRDYRVVANCPVAAIYKVVSLHNSIGLTLTAEVRVLTPEE